MQKKTFSISLDKNFLEVIDKKAKDECRSRSSFIFNCLKFFTENSVSVDTK